MEILLGLLESLVEFREVSVCTHLEKALGLLFFLLTLFFSELPSTFVSEAAIENLITQVVLTKTLFNLIITRFRVHLLGTLIDILLAINYLR